MEFHADFKQLPKVILEQLVTNLEQDLAHLNTLFIDYGFPEGIIIKLNQLETNKNVTDVEPSQDQLNQKLP
jgi:hypothetical protein